MTLRRDWISSPNYSSRYGTPVRLVVLHTAEGSRTYQSLGGYFGSSSVEASSHVGIDDTPGTIGEYVRRDYSAWTQANANPYSVAAELCAFASWNSAEWSQHPTMLANCAAWVAEECAAFDIPIMRLTAGQAQDGHTRGVCDHASLGVAGGNHWDVGGGFPLDLVIDMARGGVPTPAPKKGTHVWTLLDHDTGGYWVADETGAIFAYDAPYLGGCNNARYNAAGWPCTGLAEFSDRSGEGYCLTLDAGAGAAGDRFRRYRFPRDGSARV